jgi:hypothetical protein
MRSTFQLPMTLSGTFPALTSSRLLVIAWGQCSRPRGRPERQDAHYRSGLASIAGQSGTENVFGSGSARRDCDC